MDPQTITQTLNPCFTSTSLTFKVHGTPISLCCFKKTSGYITRLPFVIQKYQWNKHMSTLILNIHNSKLMVQELFFYKPFFSFIVHTHLSLVHPFIPHLLMNTFSMLLKCKNPICCFIWYDVFLTSYNHNKGDNKKHVSWLFKLLWTCLPQKNTC